ncbi:MAG: proton-conducting transporter membrane subunit [Gaiella sp.]
MTGALVLAGVAVIAVGGAIACARVALVAGLYTQALGAALLGGGGLAALVDGDPAGAAFSGQLEPRLGVDPLSGLFLLTLGVVGAPALVFATRYLERSRSSCVVGGLTSVFLLAMALVVCGRDPLTFLAGWELMSVAPAAAILVTRGASRGARHTVFVYIALTHLAGVGTWVAVLLLADAGALDAPGAVETGSGLQAAVAIAAVVGMGTKAGLMPLHTWLPRAHPIAPAHVSALMSGVMIKIAIYGLVRVLAEWAGVVPVWIGVLVVALGALSAVGGVVYALFQHDLKRLLAFHSVENIGIIVLGLGACLLFRARGAEAWAAVALAAALLHTLNHAVFKALLFLGAGAFEKAVGSLELDRLGGLLRRMPVAGGAFLVGAVAIAGLPPLNGFASEWATLQALLHVTVLGRVGDGVVGAVALAVLASTAALALFCFVKVIGLVLLGPPRRDACREAHDAPLAMSGGMVFLAGSCLALGVVPGLLFDSLTRVEPWTTAAGPRVGLELPSGASLPTGGIVVVLAVAAGALLLVRRGRGAAGRAPTWACGQLVEPALGWTSAGFTKPLRLVLETVLRPRREIVVSWRTGVVQRVSYAGAVPHLFDVHLYRPVTRAAITAAAHARRLQSGRLGTYVGYLILLVVVLLALAKWGVVG